MYIYITYTYIYIYYRMLKIHKTVCKMVKLMEYFTSRDWDWTNENVVRLYASMSEEDQQVEILNDFTVVVL